MDDKEQDSGCERYSFTRIFSSYSFVFRVVDIDTQRRQVSIRRPTGGGSQRVTGAEDGHNFFFDAVYDWKYVSFSGETFPPNDI